MVATADIHLTGAHRTGLGDVANGHSGSPCGLEHSLAAALAHVRRGDARPVVLSGPAGVGKSTCALALAARLQRPLLEFDVAIAGLRLGQANGLRELPLVSRGVTPPTSVETAGAPVIVIDHPERLPGGLPGNLMAGLVYMANERFPAALDHYFGVKAGAGEAVFVFTTRSGYFSPLEPSLFILELHGYCTGEKEAIATRLFEAAGRRLSAGVVKALVQRCARGPGVAELATLVQKSRALPDEESAPERLEALASQPAPSLLLPYAELLPGQAVATAWTREGGTHLIIEASFGNDVDGDLTVLGMLGDAMLSAAEVAFHVVNQALGDPALRLGAAASRPVLLNLPGSWTHKKEGRSAGLAMALAMYGLATGRKPRPRRAATGELSLGGLVLPVGTCMAKVLGAESEGLAEVILPTGSAGELRDASAALRSAIAVKRVDTFAEAVDAWFE